MPKRPLRILSKRDTLARTGLENDDAIYRLLEAGDFPQPVPLTARKIGFREDQVDEWIAERIKRGWKNSDGKLVAKALVEARQRKRREQKPKRGRGRPRKAVQEEAFSEL